MNYLTKRLTTLLIILGALSFSTFNMAYGQSAPQGRPQSKVPQAMKGPSSDSRSNPEVQKRINQERADIEKQMKSVAEALQAVEETRNAVKLIDAGNTDKARSTLANAIGKIEVVLAQHPEMALVPIAADVTVMDLLTDPKSVEKITSDVRTLVRQERYQEARRLLANFASEINIATTNVPMASYPMAIREAARMLNEGKSAEAQAALMAALNSLVITERAIPLPIVKAQALIDEISRGINEKKLDRSQANQWLDEAKNQLQLAEAMGYGTSKKDFAPLQASIDQLRGNLEQQLDTSGVIARLRTDLQNLKQKIL